MSLKAVIKKEIRSNLSSASLMITVAVYFVLMGLWLWFFPDTSIPDNKFATLQTLFDLAPWLFLFIIPALTMRSIAEEKSLGTLELLKSKPISMHGLVVGKFGATMVLITIILLISQVYTFSVYQLGFPKGNLDLGGTLGSFIAWLLLAGAYTAIGIFASAVAASQMIAFLLAVVLCFLIYAGPAFIATLPVFVGSWDYAIQWIGMQSHYHSISQGVLISSDLFYFFGVIVIFISLSSWVLDGHSAQPAFQSIKHLVKQKSRALGVGVALLLLSLVHLFSIDLTQDKRFTLGAETKSLVLGVDDIIFVEILMDGKFPAAFTRLKKAALDKLYTFNRLNKNIQYTVEDPLTGDAETIKSNQEALGRDGILPTKLTVYNGKEQEQKIMYPYAIFHFGERSIPVNLLESMDPGLPEDEILNRSVSLLEYKFGNAIQKLRMNKNPVVVFTKGHGELSVIQTADLERSLRPVYSTGRITLDSIVQISKEIDILIVAKPQTSFSTRDNFLIDQYIMNGGKIIWLIDPLFVNTDTVNASNRLKQDFVPLPYDLNLDELFFKYGWRIQPNMVLDYACSTIPLLSGYAGGNPQFEPHPWYYHPLVAPSSYHPIVHNLDRISLFYPASIDTLKTKTDLKKTILLQSSEHSRTQMSPSPINFEILRQPLSPGQFNRDPQTIGLLMEGMFPSAFENRVSSDFSQTLSQIGAEYKSISVPTKMIVYSDGDLIGNAVSPRGEPAPLGYNIYEQRIYPSNKNLILNSIEYLLDEHHMMEARNKDIKLRLLDEAKLKSTKSGWQWFNLITPAAICLLIALLFGYWRKRKYAFQ